MPFKKTLLLEGFQLLLIVRQTALPPQNYSKVENETAITIYFPLSAEKVMKGKDFYT